MEKSFEFKVTVNLGEPVIRVCRLFRAKLDTVWAAWTNAEILDRWWAPDPYDNQTHYLDFRAGGFWHYAMIGSRSEKHWYKATFNSIEPLRSYSGNFYFCNEAADTNPYLPRSVWDFSFSDEAGHTSVEITIRFKNLNELNHFVSMKVKENMISSFRKLDELLADK